MSKPENYLTIHLKDQTVIKLQRMQRELSFKLDRRITYTEVVDELIRVSKLDSLFCD
jgi:hypothetical protein